MTYPHAGGHRRAEDRSARDARSARRLARDGAVRATTRCPVCSTQVGVEHELVAHLAECGASGARA